MSSTTMQRSTLDGVTLAHRATGEGEPVLMLHGALVADTMVPVAQSPALASYRRLVLHRRGYGESSRPDPVVPVPLAAHAEDALRVLDLHEVGSAHVVGHSMGALIGLVLAARAPGRVRSLALLEAVPPTSRPAATAWLGGLGPVLAAWGAGDAEAAVTAFYDTIYQPDWRERMDPRLVAASVRDAAPAFDSDLPGLDWETGLDADQVASVRCPVLSVLGTRTVPLFAEGRTVLHEWFPWCEDADVEGGDHTLPFALPDATADAVAAFLARV